MQLRTFKYDRKTTIDELRMNKYLSILENNIHFRVEFDRTMWFKFI
jgi:hypothetical protein